MTQEIKNILMIFIAPVIVGIVLRLFFLKKRKGFIVTAVEGGITLLMLSLTLTVDTHGNEFLGIWFLMTLFAFIGCFVTEVAICIRKKIRYGKIKNIDFIPEE